MFQAIFHTKNGLNYVELSSSKGDSLARICLEEGGRLDVLTLNNMYLITDNKSFKYKDSFASAILFPFANRVNNGKYAFEGKLYSLDCNEVDNNNALHGLVYNKTFEVIKKQITSDFALIELQYKAVDISAGFPFKYNISITYKLSHKGLNLKLKVENKDNKSFPFTLGWHPYFLSADLYNSSINFESKTEVESDSKMITKGTKLFKTPMPFQIKNSKLDNAYVLENNKLLFITPNYKMCITSSAKENYLQLYTPNISNLIAIEPTTGVSDSLNNKMGLQTLESGTSYTVEYLLNLENV